MFQNNFSKLTEGGKTVEYNQLPELFNGTKKITTLDGQTVMGNVRGLMRTKYPVENDYQIIFQPDHTKGEQKIFVSEIKQIS